MLAGSARAAAQTADQPSASPQSSSALGSRLAFGPTGRMLEPGRGYVAFDGYLLAMTSVNVGVTDWFSFGAGTMPLATVGDDPTLVYWVIPKFRLYGGDRTDVAICAVHSKFLDDRLGLLYLVGTRGTEDRSVTLGAAVAYVDEHNTYEDNRGAAAALLVGGDTKLSDKWSLISENYLTTEGGVASLTWRRTRGRMTWDFSLVGPFVFGEYGYVFPTISAAWRF
jgi:hypothetical protein